MVFAALGLARESTATVIVIFKFRSSHIGHNAITTIHQFPAS